MSRQSSHATSHADATGAESTRERILSATLRLMEEQRGRGVRLEDVARAAGVSRQAVYLHFGSRTELLVAAARSLDERLRLAERIQVVAAAQTGAERIDALIGFWADYIPEIYGPAKALLISQASDEAAAAAWADRMAAFYEGCRGVIQCLVEEGTLAPQWTAPEAADFLWAALAFETWEHLTLNRGWTQEQYRDRMQQAMKRALLK